MKNIRRMKTKKYAFASIGIFLALISLISSCNIPSSPELGKSVAYEVNVKNVTARLDEGLEGIAASTMNPFDLQNNLDATRAMFAASEVQAIKAGKSIKGISKETIEVSYPDRSHSLQLYVYKPETASEILPALYWSHGGGMVLGTAQSDELTLKKYAKELNCVVVAVEYRLAPEHPFPAPLEDVYLGLKWVSNNGQSVGIDTRKIAIGGLSAGGGLTASLAQIARDRNELSFPLIYQLLMYPMLDYKNTVPLEEGEEDTYVWDKASNIFGWTAYLGHSPQEGMAPKYASPLYTEDLDGLPPALIVVGGIDLFAQEDMEYAKRLNKAGVAAELHVYPGGFHMYEFMAPDLRISKQINSDIMSGLKAAFNSTLRR